MFGVVFAMLSARGTRAYAQTVALLAELPPSVSPQSPPAEIPPATPAPAAAVPTATGPGPGFSVWGPYEANFRGGWLFDTYARGGLRARTQAGRKTADVTSDLMMYTLALAPFVSAAAYVLSRNGDWIAMTELQLVNVEAFAIIGISTWALKAFIGRERPYATADDLSAFCSGPLHLLDIRCDRGRNTSFVSGHAALTFTSAGLMCAQTAYLADPNEPTGRIVCGVAMAAAASVSMMRIVADRHYATDTLAGMALGLVSGLVIPGLLHFINGAWLPPARTLPFAAQPHDFGPTMGVAMIGIVAGSLLPLLTVPFQSSTIDRASSSQSRPRAFTLPASISLAPMITPQSAGLGLIGMF